MTSTRPPSAGVIKGRCHACNIAYWWPKSRRLRLRDAYCPLGHKLRATAHYLRSNPWAELPAYTYPPKGAK